MKIFKVTFFIWQESSVSFEILGDSISDVHDRITKIYNDEYLNGFEINGEKFRCYW